MHNQEEAVFGAGCFWGVEAAFRQVAGVTATTVGYAGGTFKNPTYKDVCSGETGHAEVVKVEYDSTQVTYDDLLNIFWEIHDPTTLNRQGPDVGDQYRSVIFYQSEEQKHKASASKQSVEQSSHYANQVVTEIISLSEFYRAEEYHQQYLEKKGVASCHIQPKKK